MGDTTTTLYTKRWVHVSGISGWGWRVTTPTGRWKIVNTNGDSELFLECLGEEGTSWVSESKLSLEIVTTFINECGGNHG